MNVSSFLIELPPLPTVCDAVRSLVSVVGSKVLFCLSTRRTILRYSSKTL